MGAAGAAPARTPLAPNPPPPAGPPGGATREAAGSGPGGLVGAGGEQVAEERGGDLETASGLAEAGGVGPQAEDEPIGGSVGHEGDVFLAGEQAGIEVEGEAGGVAGPVGPGLG